MSKAKTTFDAAKAARVITKLAKRKSGVTRQEASDAAGVQNDYQWTRAIALAKRVDGVRCMVRGVNALYRCGK